MAQAERRTITAAFRSATTFTKIDQRAEQRTAALRRLWAGHAMDGRAF